MIRILDRYVVGQFLRLFVLSLLATPPLFILGELTEDIDRYVDLGVSWMQVGRGYMYRLPEFMVWSFPIAGLIAVVFTVHGMTQHREIVAAKAGGVSFRRLMAPILLLAVPLTGVALALTELVPRTNVIAKQILGNEEVRRDVRSDFVYQSDHGLTLAARRLTMDDRRLASVLVQRQGAGETPALHVEASEARHDELGWTFMHGFTRLIHADGDETAYRFERMRLPALTEAPEDLLDDPPEDDEMTYQELGRAAEVIERSGGDAHRLRVKREQRLAIPVATLVIILFGAPLATSSKRGGTAYGVGIALGTTILYLLLFKIAGGFGSSGAIPPEVAGWSPNVAFLLAGVALMARVRT